MSSNQKLGLASKFASLDKGFYSNVEPTPLPKAKLMVASKPAMQLLGLNEIDPEYFGGAKKFADGEYIASVYAGHQFGSFVPQLGDGRAILIGELNNYEIQLKGSGKTPYSRFGDGRAVIRSCIREFLCSEAMHALGIPTTRALCVIKGDEPVQRECIEQAAVLTRLAPSHIRFGHFEYFHYTGKYSELAELVEFTRKNYFSNANIEQMFEEVVTSTAKLIARWQAYGFCHGVMNTDNMSILGITIDYGPFGFLDNYDAGHICNHSDHTGRYAYDQQPGIGLWNLQALAESLSTLLPYEKSIAILQKYQPVLVAEYSKLMRARLGLYEPQENDLYLVSELLSTMQESGTDYTNFFRELSAGEVPLELKEWHNKYKERAAAEPDKERKKKMDAVNPKFILRNYIAQQAIKKAEQGDNSELAKVLDILEKPYEGQPGNEEYAQKPPEWAAEIEVSCSS